MADGFFLCFLRQGRIGGSLVSCVLPHRARGGSQLRDQTRSVVSGIVRLDMALEKVLLSVRDA
jgi:hypothetical protein